MAGRSPALGRAARPRALGGRTQLDAVTTAWFDVEGVRELSSWQTSVRAAHLIHERWFAWAEASHLREIGHQERWGDARGVTTSIGLRHSLEHRWNVGLAGPVRPLR